MKAAGNIARERCQGGGGRPYLGFPSMKAPGNVIAGGLAIAALLLTGCGRKPAGATSVESAPARVRVQTVENKRGWRPRTWWGQCRRRSGR